MEKIENKHWLDIAETASVVASLGGAAASIIFQQVALASVPVTLAISFNLLNRNRIGQTINQANKTNMAQLIESIKGNNQAITSLYEQIEKQQKDLENLSEQQKVVHYLSFNLNNIADQVEIYQSTLNSQQQQINSVIADLRKIENVSQAIQAYPEDAEFYYERGINRQNRGDYQGAIQDYSQAIKYEPTLAKAYENRGLLNAELGNRKQALQDLRQAAKLYCDRGELENYKRAKKLNIDFYAVPSQEGKPNGDSSEKILISNLFS